jgi:hypothetical protein
MARSVLPLGVALATPKGHEGGSPTLKSGGLGVVEPPPLPMGMVRSPQGQNEKKRILRVWPLGMAKLPPMAKTDIDFYFYFVWFGHPRLAKGVAQPSTLATMGVGRVFIFSILLFFN